MVTCLICSSRPRGYGLYLCWVCLDLHKQTPRHDRLTWAIKRTRYFERKRAKLKSGRVSRG